MMLNDAKADSPDAPITPNTEQGCVLFVDLCGFSKLTESFSETQGRDGADAVIAILNRVFDAIVPSVYNQGGTVVSFAGDAIFCFFPAKHNHAASAEAATAAVWQIQAKIRALPPAQIGVQTVPLAIKAVLTTGQAHRFHCGLTNIREFECLTGEAVDRNALATDKVPTGAIWLDDATRQALPKQLVTSPCEVLGSAAFFQLENWLGKTETQLHPVTTVKPHSCLPSNLLDQLNQNDQQRGYLSQMRPIAAVFLGFSVTHTSDDLAEESHFVAFVNDIQQTTDKLGGSLVQVTTGEKGNYCYLVFGAPTSTGEDAERAVNCAFKLQELAAKHPAIAALKFGIGYGTAWSGLYGTTQRNHYAALGPEVNLAAGLLQQANPDQIYVSAKLASHLKYVDLSSAQQVVIKAGMPPVAYHIAHAPRSMEHNPLHLSQTLYGRERELAELTKQISTSDPYASPCAIITGDPGVGKSSLLAALHRQQQQHFHFVASATQPQEEFTAFFAWRTLLLGLLAANPDDNPAIVEELSQRLEHHPQAAHVSLLNQIVPLGLPVPIGKPSLDKSQTIQTLASLLLALISNCPSPKPLVLVIEDCHWLDAASSSLLEAIEAQRSAQHRHRWLLTTRPQTGAEAEAQSKLFNQIRGLTTVLSPLSLDTTTTLIECSLGSKLLPPQLCQWVFEKSEGNPLHVMELSRTLLNKGIIKKSGPSVRFAKGLSNLATIDLPSTIEAILQARLDRLPEQCRQLLSVAALWQRTFSAKQLAQITGRQLAEIDQQLSLAAKEQLLESQWQHSEQYSFRHALIQDACSSRLTQQQRQPLHQKICGYYQRFVNTSNRETSAARLAHHYQQAGLSLRAMYYWEIAAFRSLRLGASSEASKAFSQLLQLQQEQAFNIHTKRIISWHEGCAEANFLIGNVSMAEQQLSRVAILTGRPLPSSPPKLAMALAYEFLVQIGHQILPQTLWRRPGHQRMATTRCKMARQLSEIYYFKNQPAQVLHALMMLVNAAEQTADPVLESQAFAAVSSTSGIMRLHKQQNYFERKAYEAYNALDSSRSASAAKVIVEQRLSLSRLAKADLAGASKLCDLAASRVEHAHEDQVFSQNLVIRIMVLFLSQQYTEALTRIDELEAFYKRASVGAADLCSHIQPLMFRVHAYARLGQWDNVKQARQSLLAAQAVSNIAPHNQAGIYYNLGVSYFLEMRFDDTLDCVKQFLPLINKSFPETSHRVELYALYWEAILCRWELEGIRPHAGELRLARRLMRNHSLTFQVSRARWYSLNAMQNRLQGKTRKASKLAAKARATAQQYEQNYESLRAEIELAKLLPAQKQADELATLSLQMGKLKLIPEVEKITLYLSRL